MKRLKVFWTFAIKQSAKFRSMEYALYLTELSFMSGSVDYLTLVHTVNCFINKSRMTLVSGRSSTLNPNAPLFVPAAVRQVEDFSPEWWDLVTTSTWYHDYWLSQQQGEGGFFANTADDLDVTDLLPDSLEVDEDTLAMEAQYEQFLLLTEMERTNAFAPSTFKQMPSNGLQMESEAMRDLTSSKAMRGPKSPVEVARYWEKPSKPVSPKSRAQRIQQPR